jgi:hypothetical protein
MPYVLRFVQRYRPSDRSAFLDLEAKFAALERRRADLPKGRRRQPYAGREPQDTLIWEAEFATLGDVQETLARLGGDKEHESLFALQSPYILEAYTEIDQVLDL